MSLAAANREVYGFLKDGIPVSVQDPKDGGQKTERVRVIDWDNPAANDLLLVNQRKRMRLATQQTVRGECRPGLWRNSFSTRSVLNSRGAEGPAAGASIPRRRRNRAQR